MVHNLVLDSSMKVFLYLQMCHIVLIVCGGIVLWWMKFGARNEKLMDSDLSSFTGSLHVATAQKNM